MTIGTPNNINVLLHYHTKPTPHPRSDAPAVIEVTDMLHREGCIYDEKGCWCTTDKGQAWVMALCNTEIPRELFLDAQGNVLK